MRGQVVVWSTLWQNTVVVDSTTTNYIFTNVPVLSPCDTKTSPVIGTNIVVIGQTNLTVTIQVYYQAMMVDATALTTVVPVVVYDLIAHSPNTVVNDNMTLVQNLLVDGTSFTLNGNITHSRRHSPESHHGYLHRRISRSSTGPLSMRRTSCTSRITDR